LGRKVGNETKSFNFKQRTAKIKPKKPKKNYKITKIQKNLSLSFLVCAPKHQINLLFLLSIFLQNIFYSVLLHLFP
jgi:hypothetical protein